MISAEELSPRLASFACNDYSQAGALIKASESLCEPCYHFLRPPAGPQTGARPALTACFRPHLSRRFSPLTCTSQGFVCSVRRYRISFLYRCCNVRARQQRLSSLRLAHLGLVRQPEHRNEKRADPSYPQALPATLLRARKGSSPGIAALSLVTSRLP